MSLDEEEDNEILIPIEEDEEQAQQPQDHDGDEDDEEEDERLAQSEDDTDDEVTSKNREKRHKRKELRKRAQERAERELAMLREQVNALNSRLAATEGVTLRNGESQIDREMQDALLRIQQAEAIMARAMEAGNGEDHITAQKIKEAEQYRFAQLQQAKVQYQQVQQRPMVNPMAQSYAQQWMQANPWYDANGRDEDSRITKAIDDGLMREGYDPTSLEYWEELTSRVAARINVEPATSARERRKSPPMGNTREHAPASTKNGFLVDPKRKEAMIEAGVWDDPVKRNQILKAYREYDRANGTAR